MSWKTEFKEQLQLLEGNPLVQGEDSLLLFYALENQIIPEGQYWSWAQKQTHIAKISPLFFSEKSPSQELFQKYREKMPWSKALLPVGEWDGYLLIAGVLKPHSLPQDVLFFYANPESLLKYSEVYFAQESSHPGESSIVQIQTEQPSTELVLVDGDPFESEASPTEDSPLFEDSEEEKLDLNLNAPSNFNLDFTQLSSSEKSPPKVEVPQPETTPSEEKSNLISLNEVLQPPPVTEEVKATPTLVTDEVVPQDSVSLKTPVGIKGKNQVGYYLSQWNTKTLSTTFKETFEKMKTHFDRCLVLSLSDDDQKAKVLFWDSVIQEPQQDSPISLKTPSIFYISAKTAKPFHGPISINEENEKFFELWNKGKIPAHTTLVPIIIKDQVIALLMGIGESSSYNRATLHFAEKMGNHIAQSLNSAQAAS